MRSPAGAKWSRYQFRSSHLKKELKYLTSLLEGRKTCRWQRRLSASQVEPVLGGEMMRKSGHWAASLWRGTPGCCKHQVRNSRSSAAAAPVTGFPPRNGLSRLHRFTRFAEMG